MRSTGPMAMVIDDEPANRAFAVAHLGDAGWQVTTSGDGADALAQLARGIPALVLLDLQMEPMSGLEVLRAIRAAGPPLAGVAVIAFTTVVHRDPGTLIRLGFDGLLAKPCTPDELVAAAARWWPDGVMADAERLIAGFGAEQMAPLLASLRDQLEASLSNPEGAIDAVQAHRLAGTSGTLGFPTLSALWQQAAAGDESVHDGLRIETRRVIAALDRQRQNNDPD